MRDRGNPPFPRWCRRLASISARIGRLTQSFNSMVGELRIKAQIRETFGKYVDPRIVAGLIDRPELTDAKGSRREMTILFCDMKGFTTFSEGMTPAALVAVLNRYMTVMSEPVRRHSGIIDKYIGDAIMAFWGPPFTGADEQARLACLAALDQVAGFAAFRAELPDLIGFKRGFPEIDMRIGIATGDVVVGSIGSEQTRNYTVIGDTVNLASRLEGANKTYGTRVLISEATTHLAGDTVEMREIDSVLVVGKTEPRRRKHFWPAGQVSWVCQTECASSSGRWIRLVASPSRAKPSGAMLAIRRCAWSVRLRACIFGGAPAGVFVPVAVSGLPQPC